MKNTLIVGIDDREIKYLGDTSAGKTHDKKMCDEEEIDLPKGSNLYQDLGYQGLSIEGVTTHQPIKKPKGKELSEADKLHNRIISSIRVVVEHIISGVKRCHIVKNVFRNTKMNYDDLVMENACGLHNFRNHIRNTTY